MELAHFYKNEINKPHLCKYMTVQGGRFEGKTLDSPPLPGHVPGGVEGGCEVGVRGRRKFRLFSAHLCCLACSKEHILLL